MRYGWKPDICTSCQSFGHTSEDCSRLSSDFLPFSDREPLPPPPVLRWVPKTRPLVPTSTPSTVIPETMPDSAPSPVVPIPPPQPLEPSITWLESESRWIDLKSHMRYDPSDDSFYRFVTPDMLDLRRLFYCPCGDSLVLDTDGRFGLRNAEVLSDSSWDRLHIYSSVSVDYDPCLALLFQPYARVIGDVAPGSSVDGTLSSSVET